MPRKYTKDNYFIDLSKKIPMWKSIEQQRKRVAIYVDKATHSPLSATQNEVLDYLADMSQRRSTLLLLPSVAKAYNELQELLYRRTDVEDLTSMCSDMNTQMFLKDEGLGLLINAAEDLKRKQRVQNQRISDVRALIRHLTKQIESEQRRIQEENIKNKEGLLGGFQPFLLLTHLFMKPRIFRLRRMIVKEETEIKKIELDFQRRAKSLCEEGDKRLSKEKCQEYIDAFKSFFPVVDKELIKQYQIHQQLQLGLAALKKVIEEAEKKQAEASKKPVVNQDEVERNRIRQAFEKSLAEKQNLILRGAGRTIGLTFSTISEICEDELYRDDIVEHLRMLIKTPMDEDFIFHGAKRWKVFISNRSLYELSILPKTGPCESMPRLYFKKEQFYFERRTPILTNKKEAEMKKKSITSVWIGVKKGSKRTQGKDGELAGRVLFENDGEHRDGLPVINSFPWLKFDIHRAPESPRLWGNSGNGM